MMLVLVFGVALVLASAGRLGAEAAMDYPASKTVDIVDDYHGTAVADPYRWLEQIDSSDTQSWIEAQNRLTEKYLATLPLRTALQKRITELWNYPKVSVPVREGGRLWYRKNRGLERQSSLYSKDNLAAPPRLVIDPNALSSDGSLSLAQTTPSPDGRFLAYSVAESGVDWETIYIRDLKTGRDLTDAVSWARYARIAWTHDGKGFFYSRYPEPRAGVERQSPSGVHGLYYHRLGKPQAADRLIYRDDDHPQWFVRGRVTGDGRYLIVRVSQGSGRRNRLYYLDLQSPGEPNLDGQLRHIVGSGEALYRFFGNVGTSFYVLTDSGAPRRKVVAFAINSPNPAGSKTVVPEGPQVIQDAVLSGGKIVVQYLVEGRSRLKFFALSGRELGELAPPGIGTIRNLSGRYETAELFYSFTSPLFPSTVFVCKNICRAPIQFEAAKPAFDGKAYETKQLFATSKDGTRVPYFLTAHKKLPLDGDNPTLLYGYGGFSNSLTPRYRPDLPAWLELGGIFVTADIRGGGAYGEAWHRDGMLDKKQNSFDDFIAVAEDLIRRGYTAPQRLAIQGSSNGGLLVAAVSNQRPDLFAAATPAAGVLDMLRYDKFTAGGAWRAEYGAPSDPTMFGFLIRYSPLQNVKAGVCYPATLILTGDRDDRVVPSHSFKYSAALQKAQSCNRPVLLRVDRGTSHSYRPTDRRIAEIADRWAFIAAQTGVKARRAD
ncbi:MAG TPA: prolyl oligopeptidase family serine peptidase [Candidatus Binatia bacterium]|nr:prolyl oligopeptidase family serine peptidase [Candidatus Binatia bacterium]